MDKSESTQTGAPSQPLIEHLIELRQRLMYALFAVLICFIPAMIFAVELFELLSAPVLKYYAGSQLISTNVIGPFLTPFKFAIYAAAAIAAPVLFYQLWAFVAPGLYKHERRIVLPLVVSSTLLFYLGILFAYFVVFPMVFRFLAGWVPTTIQASPDIGQYLDFVLTMFFAFGMAFEVPVATVLLVIVGATTPEKLAEKRAYVFLGAFVAGMVLTPPDIISQILLALPMYVLFELGIVMARVAVRTKEQDSESESA